MSMKNKSEVGFEQPKHGGSAPMPKHTNTGKDVQKKMGKETRKQPKVGPKFTSTDAVLAFRKKKYGV